jgi:methionyl-tRNA formyltransferase
MRLVFAGTPAFGQSALRALLDAGHDVAMVLTQPDRPAGRGLRARPSEVKALSVARGLPVVQPATLKSDEVLERLQSARAQVMVVAAYGLILPLPVLELFPLGCINIHASLLPRWRGAAPIQRAILAGDRETGVSIMRMEAGLDTGPVYLAHSLVIEPDDTAGSLHDKLAVLGGRCVVQVLARLEAGSIRAVAQPEPGVTYANKIEKHEAAIDWSHAAAQIERQVRAFNPFPGASTSLRGVPVRVWRARAAVDPQRDAPGRVIAATNAGILVGCGSGALLLQEVQRAGGKVLPAADFLRGVVLAPGEIFGR